MKRPKERRQLNEKGPHDSFFASAASRPKKQNRLPRLPSARDYRTAISRLLKKSRNPPSRPPKIPQSSFKKASNWGGSQTARPAHTAGSSSALEIARDLQPRAVRTIFFSNVPAMSEKSLRAVIRRTSAREKQKEQVLQLLNSQRPAFVKGIRELLRLKRGETYICEVFNHTAFHQNMNCFKEGSAQMDLCLLGIRFIEGCLDEAYAAERPGTQRMRYFRFPFSGRTTRQGSQNRSERSLHRTRPHLAGRNPGFERL